MKVIVSGGGTGGHIYPALAIAERIREEIPRARVLYVGGEQGLEADIVGKTDIPFTAIKAKGLPRKINKALAQSLFSTGQGVWMADRIIKRFRPDLVIGTGGFVCGPTVLAAARRGIPTLIHEQNAYPGLTNKLLAPFVKKVMIQFPEAAQYFSKRADVVVTGLPMRKDIAMHSKEEGCAFFGLDASRRTILVTGGSRGARAINRVMAMAAPMVLKNYDVQIIFVTGKACHEETLQLLQECELNPADHSRLVVKDYLYDMPYALAAADIVIGRAGATFLAEITYCGLPAILIPFPYASENHQTYNAQALVDAGAARMIADRDLTVPRLMEHLAALLDDPALCRRMAVQMKRLAKPHALDDIMDIIRSYQ